MVDKIGCASSSTAAGEASPHVILRRPSDQSFGKCGTAPMPPEGRTARTRGSRIIRFRIRKCELRNQRRPPKLLTVAITSALTGATRGRDNVPLYVGCGTRYLAQDPVKARSVDRGLGQVSWPTGMEWKWLCQEGSNREPQLGAIEPE